MRWFALFALLAAGALCACENQANAPATPVANTAYPAESPYHNVRPPEEYFQVLTPQLRADLETTGIPRDLGDSATENVVVTEANYLAALSKAQSNGLERLSEDERLTVLFVSVAALAAQEETVTYTVAATDATSKAQIGALTVAEMYRFDTYDGYTLPNLSRRQVTGDEMAWDFGSSPHYAVDAPQEVIESYDFANGGSEDEKVTRIRCERTNGTWSRYLSDYTEQYALDWFLHIVPNVEFSSLSAEPREIETVQGRSAYKLIEVSDFGLGRGTERRYWLDKETLWPLQWEFEIDGDSARSLGWEYQGHGYIVRGTVEEINTEINIPLLSEGTNCGG
jgi:hypothetical protein